MKFRRFPISSMLMAVALLCATVPSSHAFAGSDAPERTPAPLPFEPSEQLVYEAEFSKLMLRGIKIAEFKFSAGRAPSAVASGAQTNATGISTGAAGVASTEMTVQPTVIDAAVQTGGNASKASANPLLFIGDIESKGWFRKLFGINFHFRIESTVEPASFAILRTTKLDEQGKRVRTSEALFDRAENKIAWTERDPNDPKREPRIITNPLGGAMHDIISAIYFLRTQPLAPGKTFDLVVSDSGQIYHVPATVSAEKKKMKSPLGKVSVVRVDVGLFGDDRPVKGNGRMSMWVTDDARRLPIRAKLSSDLGTLDITLKSIKA